MANRIQNLLHKDLSYALHGAAIEVRRDFGSGHKESIYQNAFAEELKSRNINFEREKSIKIVSPKTGKSVGLYRPDFLIDNKIIVELKAQEKIPKTTVDQLYDYLRNSEYELGYFINFSSPRLFVKRIIYTNDRKFNGFRKLLVAFSVLLVVISVLGAFRPAFASEFIIDAGKEAIGVGQQFEAQILLSTQNKSINAIGGEIRFSPDFLEPKEVRDGNSIISFWIEKPIATDGAIKFSGIVPGGYNGQNGAVLSVIFEAKKEGRAEIFMENIQVLLNDGLGTEDAVVAKKLEFRIGKTGNASVPAIYDNEMPENFKPLVGKSPGIFDGKWFITFITQDKLSGIDYYQIQERWLWFPSNEKWVKTESPHVLTDQWRLSYVFVRALDKSGNARVVTLPPRIPIYAVYAIFDIIAAGILLFIFRRRIWKI